MAQAEGRVLDGGACRVEPPRPDELRQRRVPRLFLEEREPPLEIRARLAPLGFNVLVVLSGRRRRSGRRPRRLREGPRFQRHFQRPENNKPSRDGPCATIRAHRNSDFLSRRFHSNFVAGAAGLGLVTGASVGAALGVRPPLVAATGFTAASGQRVRAMSSAEASVPLSILFEPGASARPSG